MDPKTFGDNKTGRFLPTLLGNSAFVPDPLVKLEVPLDWSLVRLLSEADAAVSEVTGACRRHINPLLVLRPFQRREAILSSRIEGTITTARELVAMEAKPEKEAEREHTSETREVRNYLDALDLGINRLSEIPLSLRLIRELHKRLMDGVRGERNTPGEFRKHQAAIGKEGQSEKDARFVPPPPQEMHACLDDFEKFLHDDRYPPLVKMAIMHYQFETIHPFGDGNGRTGRLLIPLCLLSDERMDRPVLYLSPYFEKHDQEYRDHLLAISQRGTWTEWISFVLRGVVVQCKDTIERLNTLEQMLSDYKARVQQAPGELQAIVEELFALPAVTTEAILKKFPVSHQTAMNWIRRLQTVGILNDTMKSGRHTLYICRELL